MSEFKTVRGMRDLVAEDAETLRSIEDKARKVAKLHGFREIVTPVVESYELLSAKAGDEVRSRMFTFKDLGDRSVALRPEFTSSVARLVATTLKNAPRPLRLFCIGSIYRYDEPQKGRYREFWQSNYELMGSAKPEADVEILTLTNRLMKTAGLRNYKFKIGHVGVLREIFRQENLDEKAQNTVMQLMDKQQYDDALELVEKTGASDKCTGVLRELVKLRGDDTLSVVEQMKTHVKDYEKAVLAAENLCEILKLLKESDCKIDLTVDAGFTRGLEYYTGMIFETYVPDLSVALGGGGRYDRLIELFRGEPTPAVGVAHGIDRIMLALKEQKTQPRTRVLNRTIVIPIGDNMKAQALRISQMLRDANVSVEVEVMGRKMAKALEDADRRRIDHAVIVGEREFREGAVIVKNLREREQSTVKIGELASVLNAQTNDEP